MRAGVSLAQVPFGVSFAVAAFACFALVTTSDAAQLPIRNASLSVRISDLAELEIPQSPGSPVLSVSGSRTETELLSLTLPADLFTVLGVSATITDPLISSLVAGVEMTDVRNDRGVFGPVGGGSIGGPMAIRGVFRICLFTICNDPGSSFVTLDSRATPVIGQTGTVAVDPGGLLDLTVRGAPWTSGTAQVGSDGETGSIGPAPGDDGFLAVRLVTPIRIETDLTAPFDLIPAFGIASLEVPEPAGLVLGLAAFGALTALGVSRRRA